MYRGSEEYKQASKLLDKMAGRVNDRLKLQYQDIKDKPFYYPHSFSFHTPASFSQTMEVSSVEVSFGKWDKSKGGQQYQLLQGEQFLDMRFAVPKTAEQWVTLEEKIVETARAFLK